MSGKKRALIRKSIKIFDDQDKFLEDKNINLSSFVRSQLDKRMKEESVRFG